MKDGGPAFPSTTQYFPHDTNCDEQLGMSLRDYFAAKVMQSLIGLGETDYPCVCKASYIVADEMLKEREK